MSSFVDLRKSLPLEIISSPGINVNDPFLYCRLVKLNFSPSYGFQGWVLCNSGGELIPAEVVSLFKIKKDLLRKQLEAMPLKEREIFFTQKFQLNIRKYDDNGYKILISPKLLGGGACHSTPTPIEAPTQVTSIPVSNSSQISVAGQQSPPPQLPIPIPPVNPPLIREVYYVKNIAPASFSAPAFQAIDKLKSTKELTAILESLSMEDRNYAPLQALALAVLELFAKREGKTKPIIDEAVALAEAGNIDISKTLLKILIKEINSQELLDIDLLKALSRTLRNASVDALDPDDLIRVLNIIMEKIQLIHQQETTNIKLFEILKVTSDILDSMGDYNVINANRLNLHEPLYDILEKLSTHQEMSIAAEAAYAKQALVRVPNDETKLSNFLRRGTSVVKGILSLGKVLTDKNPSELIDAFKSFKEAWKHQESVKTWQNEIRMMKILIGNGAFLEFEKFLKSEANEVSNPLVGGNCLNLLFDLIQNHGEITIRQCSLRFMTEIFLNDERWGNDKKLKKEVLVKLIYCLGYPDPQLRESAKNEIIKLKDRAISPIQRSLFEVMLPDDLNAIPIRVRNKVEEVSIILITTALRSSFETLEQKVFRLKEKVLNDEHVSKELATYIPVQGSRNIFDPKEGSFYLEEAITNFLDSNRPVFLLVGDSGGGKSTFLRYLERKLWQDWKPGLRIPLFISLPTLKSFFQDAIIESLKSLGFSEQECKELKANYSFLFLLDGYDELKSRNNLYVENRLHEWKGQSIITCRTQFLMGNQVSYRNFFVPQSESLLSSVPLDEAAVSPFSNQQIELYCKKYIELNSFRRTWLDYKNDFALVPGLNEMIETPFILRIIVEVLPFIIQKHQQNNSNNKLQLFYIDIFDAFVKNWFHREEQRLIRTGQWNEPFDVKKEFNSFCKQLALDMIQKGVVTVEYEESLGLFNQQTPSAWSKYFASKPEQLALVRSGVPIRKIERSVGSASYGFIHKSLLEYFGARAIVSNSDQPSVNDSSALEYKSNLENKSNFEFKQNHQNQITLPVTPLASPATVSSISYEALSKIRLVEETEIIKLLAEAVAKDPTLESHLFAIIERSKTDPTAAIAAANAITILNTAAVSFSNKDFRDIRIPGANLFQAILFNADLRGADLTNVKIYDACLDRANLSQAKVEGIDFGQKFYLKHSQGIASVAVFPDGKWLVAGEQFFGHLTIWDLHNGKEVKKFRAHKNGHVRVAVSPDGKQILTGGGDGIKLWDVQSWNELLFLKGHTDDLTNVLFSEDGKKAFSLAGGQKDQTIRQWDLSNGNELNCIKERQYINSIAISLDGMYIVSSSGVYGLILRNLANGKEVLLAEGKSYGVAFSKDGKKIVSGIGNNVCVWDTESLKQIWCLTGHAKTVGSVTFSPDSKYAFSGGDDGTVRSWDLSAGKELFCCQPHTNGINQITTSPDGKYIYSAGADNKITILRVQRASNFKMKQIKYTQYNCSPPDFSSDGKQVLTYSGTEACVWDLNLYKPILNFRVKVNNRRIESGVLSPRKDFAVLGYDSGTHLWNFKTDSAVELAGKSHNRLALSNDGNLVLSSTKDKKIILSDINLNKQICSLDEHEDIDYLAFSRDNKYAVSASTKTVRFWDLNSVKEIYCLNFVGFKGGIAFSPKENQALIASAHSTISLIDLSDGKEVKRFNVGHLRPRSISYSPNGKYFICGGHHAEKFFLYDISRSDKELFEFDNNYGIDNLQFLSDGRHCLSSDLQPSMKLWQVFDERGELNPSLLWISSGILSGKKIQVDGIQGLTDENKLLLEQLTLNDLKPASSAVII